MSPFEMIKSHLSAAVPFANTVGVTLSEIGPGHASASLAQRKETSNHIDTQHAGAMFTLGEAVSGAALAGALAPEILTLRPVAAGAQIEYVKIAKGTLTATATTARPAEALLAELKDVGKVAFDVTVEICDADGDAVARMRVSWHVRKAG